MPTSAWILIALAAMLAGAFGGFGYCKDTLEKKIGRADSYAKELLNDATRKAEEKKKETILEAKEEVLRLKGELDKEINDRRSEQKRAENRVARREETLDRKLDNLEKREELLNLKAEDITKRLKEAEALRDRQAGELERIAGLTAEEATRAIIARVEKEAYHDAAALVRDIEQNAREEGNKKARNIIAMAIQKCASDHVAETTVSVISLPNDDMKGRIIGREGRNIRAL
ncbi:MAG TPA: Rnase Y domain-containing protein, partial [Clostridia bacterium]|nr:Rnase Y domain-containing protein [Clostridia bacterium]